ncbi:MAG TPA: hypothetical protein VNM92_09600 [Thermoanaerobaculia bacterium]|nr:hypothetical protein [Thermoanaerobaculia bacterium]
MLSIAILASVAVGVLWLVLYMFSQKAVTTVQSLIHQGRYQDAVDEADRALASNSSNATTHLHRAEALKLLGRFEESFSSYQEAITFRKGDAASREGAALARAHQGRELGDARRLMEETLAQYPEIQEFQALSLAYILLRDGRRDEALRLFEDNLVLLQTRFEFDYTDRDPLLAETIYIYSELSRESGDVTRANALRKMVREYAPGSIFAEWSV